MDFLPTASEMEVEALKVEMRSSYGINLIEVIMTSQPPTPPQEHIQLPTPSPLTIAQEHL